MVQGHLDVIPNTVSSIFTAKAGHIAKTMGELAIT
jgi:hypothetical protein